MATAPSNPSPVQQHSPGAAVEGPASSSSPSRRLGGSGAVGSSSAWNQIVVRGGGGDFESSISSSLAAVTLGVAPPATVSGVTQEQTMITSPDGSPTKGSATASEAAPFSSLPEDATEVQSDGTDNGSGGNNASKKPAWSKPSKGGTEVGPVMGAHSWPALSESTRHSPKSSPDSLKTPSDISTSAAQTTIQGTGTASPTPHKQGNNSNSNPSSTPNHAPYNRQRSMKRNSGNSSNSVAAVNGGFSQLPSPRGSGGEMTSNNSGRHGNSSSDPSSRENTHRDGGQRGSYGSQSHGGNEHHQQRNSFRRGNGGTHPRGDGSHHHSYGGRRSDQDRANQDWNQNRGFGGRDSHMPPQRVPSRPFMRGPPPPGPAPFIPPPLPVRPFGSPIVYPEVPMFYFQGPHPESVRAVPMMPQMPQVYYPVVLDPQLPSKIVNQIEYYFSNENLIKDTFLRQNMDDQGWVPIKLIANFKKVAELTNDISLILDSVRSSTLLEVEGEKVRKRTDWMKWLMPPSTPVQYMPVSSPQSIQKYTEDQISANLQNVSLDDKSKHYSETHLSPSSSGEWSSHSQQFSGEKSNNVAFPGGNSSK